MFRLISGSDIGDGGSPNGCPSSETLRWQHYSKFLLLLQHIFAKTTYMYVCCISVGNKLNTNNGAHGHNVMDDFIFGLVVAKMSQIEILSMILCSVQCCVLTGVWLHVASGSTGREDEPSPRVV